jgi:hypothetical protein
VARVDRELREEVALGDVDPPNQFDQLTPVTPSTARSRSA